MERDIDIKQITELLRQPSAVSEADLNLLTDLADRYPYFQPVHLLLAKAGQSGPQAKQLLAKASLYNGGRVVYKAFHLPHIFDDTLPLNPPNFSDEYTAADQLSDEQETFEEIGEIGKVAFNTGPEQARDPIQEEVFEEINELDPATYNLPAQEMPKAAEADDSSPWPVSENVPDELVIERIVSNDFFAFEKSFNTEPAGTEPAEERILILQPEEYDHSAEAQSRVSKYDDDNMPYTFLWWLAKTRKEHEQIFQPYVSSKKTAAAPAGALQQQYVEHIFHLQTPFNLNEEAGKINPGDQPKSKGSEIIDNFIKNEPQIKAPKAEQLNTENKAKKSAEDHYDLVSETLASIYIEQMLYHKAIDTYEKLSLKFPEKSRYFADLIQSLEKKI